MDIEELKKLAEAATPGPWDYDTHDTPFQVVNGEVVGGDCTGIGEVYTGYDVPYHSDNFTPEPHVVAREVAIKDGRFMRAANPQAVLALIEKIESLENMLIERGERDE